MEGGGYPATPITQAEGHLFETPSPKVRHLTSFTQDASLFEDGYDTEGENGPYVVTVPEHEDDDNFDDDNETDAATFQTEPPPSQPVPLESTMVTANNDAFNGVFVNKRREKRWWYVR